MIFTWKFWRDKVWSDVKATDTTWECVYLKAVDTEPRKKRAVRCVRSSTGRTNIQGEVILYPWYDLSNMTRRARTRATTTNDKHLPEPNTLHVPGNVTTAIHMSRDPALPGRDRTYGICTCIRYRNALSDWSVVSVIALFVMYLQDAGLDVQLISFTSSCFDLTCYPYLSA